MSQAQLQIVADLEMEMMSDMYRRMTNACQQKCIATHYSSSNSNSINGKIQSDQRLLISTYPLINKTINQFMTSFVFKNNVLCDNRTRLCCFHCFYRPLKLKYLVLISFVSDISF
uniref:Mitochondrial import inner membrane translocase subunit n=1 Tax=Parascaris univalens TaxID=6257 RepID=A0A915AWA1_PARUN